MATPESKVKAKVRRLLEPLGVLFITPIGSGFGTGGVSDQIACYRGRYVAIEVKADKPVPSALQEVFLRKVVEAGGVALVAGKVITRSYWLDHEGVWRHSEFLTSSLGDVFEVWAGTT